MSDFNTTLELIKRAAVEAVDSSKPTSVCFGKVISASPLQISVEQKMTLGARQLILTRAVTSMKASVTGGNIQSYFYAGAPPNTATQPVSPSHTHAMGEISVTVHNGLVVGDEVILLRQQGGQKYIVLDRIVT